MPAVKASFFRISGTLNAFRNVRSIGGLVLDQLAGAACGLDLLACGRGEAVGVHGERLRYVALAEDLHGNLAARCEVLLAQGVGGHLGPLVEARLEVPQVHRLGVRAELLERHRLLHVRSAQLAHPHVDRRLAALEVDPLLRAGARARALVAAARGLAGPGALAAADALARLARARCGLQRVESDAAVREGPGGARTGALLFSHLLAPDAAPRAPSHGPWGDLRVQRFARSFPDQVSSATRCACGSRPRTTSPE